VFYLAILILSGGNLLLQGWVLDNALHSLFADHDSSSGGVVITLVVWGLAYVLALVILDVYLKSMLHKDAEAGAEGTSQHV
jgi:hypothetical protein